MKDILRVLLVGSVLGSGVAHAAEAEPVLDPMDKQQIEFLYNRKVFPDNAPIAWWGKDGHQYTTFIVARLAGWDVEPAVELCWGSQIPDETKWFTAVWGAVPTVFGSRYHRSLMTTLHSLHGGSAKAVMRRQGDLQDLVTRQHASKAMQPWQIGLIIHAFGDSFAHVRDDGRAFGYPLGHALAGHGPDTISTHKDAYIPYVKALFASLAGKPANEELAPLFAVVETLTANEDDSVTKMATYAIKLGLTPAIDKAAREKWKTKISRHDIEATMAIMEASFDN